MGWNNLAVLSGFIADEMSGRLDMMGSQRSKMDRGAGSRTRYPLASPTSVLQLVLRHALLLHPQGR